HEVTGQRASVAGTYLEDIARGHLDKTALLSSASYVNFVDAYIRLKSRGDLGLLHQDLPTELLLSRYLTLRDEPLSAPIRDFLLGEMFRNFTVSYGPRDWGRVLTQFTTDSPEHPVAKQYGAVYQKAAAVRSSPDEIRTYKTADGNELEAHVFLPKGAATTQAPSAFLFFHGGGWSIGSPEWGYKDCERMAALGMVAVSFEYRIADVHGTDIVAALEDVRSAIAWARAELNIDRNRVVAAGFSAGGHLAASSAILAFPEFGGAETRPNALVVQSSSYDLTKSSFFGPMTQGRPKEFSLTHAVRSTLIPSLFIHGRRDTLAPLREFQEFTASMAETQSDFEYHVFNTGHFFRDAQVDVAVAETVRDFLTRRGFLSPRKDAEPQ
ncbi:MAG: alpha/beta hydrolase, partial [Erythrobacter sp.]|nr:alpha/beta hydrolase [Erythrobacter sp.]